MGYPCCMLSCMCWYFISFYCQVTFPCGAEPHFISSSVDGHLGCFHFGADMNLASLSTCLFSWTYIFNSLGCTPKSGIAGLCTTLNLASLQSVQSFTMIWCKRLSSFWSRCGCQQRAAAHTATVSACFHHQWKLPRNSRNAQAAGRGHAETSLTGTSGSHASVVLTSSEQWQGDPSKANRSMYRYTVNTQGKVSLCLPFLEKYFVILASETYCWKDP